MPLSLQVYLLQTEGGSYMNPLRYDELSLQVRRYLKRELRHRGITQEAFAEQIGVSDCTVRRWISGDIHSLEAVAEIASALNVNARYIFNEDIPVLFAAYTGRKLSCFHCLRLYRMLYPNSV